MIGLSVPDRREDLLVRRVHLHDIDRAVLHRVRCRAPPGTPQRRCSARASGRPGRRGHRAGTRDLGCRLASTGPTRPGSPSRSAFGCSIWLITARMNCCWRPIRAKSGIGSQEGAATARRRAPGSRRASGSPGATSSPVFGSTMCPTSRSRSAWGSRTRRCLDHARRVHVVGGDAHVDAAEGVHDLLEPVEVDVEVVVDRDAGQSRHGRLGHELRAAALHPALERGVDLVRAVPRDVDPQVARERQRRSPSSGSGSVCTSMIVSARVVPPMSWLLPKCVCCSADKPAPGVRSRAAGSCTAARGARPRR